MSDTIVINRRQWGLLPLRVLVERRARHAAKPARAMLRAGKTLIAIQKVCGFSEPRLAVILQGCLWTQAEAALFTQAHQAVRFTQARQAEPRRRVA